MRTGKLLTAAILTMTLTLALAVGCAGPPSLTTAAIPQTITGQNGGEPDQGEPDQREPDQPETSGQPALPSVQPQHDQEQQYQKDDTITVPGLGTHAAQPDLIHIQMGATHTGQDPLAALGEVTQAIRAMLNAAGQQGVMPQDIRTNTFQVHEKLVYDNTKRQQVREGFTASQEARITIRDPEQAGTVIGELIQATGSASQAEVRVRRIESEIENPAPIRLEALRKATENMWEQARTVAEASGREVCRLVETQADGAGQLSRTQPPKFHLESAMRGIAMEAESLGSRAAISPGTLRQTSRVTGTFTMVDAGQERNEARCGNLP